MQVLQFGTGRIRIGAFALSHKMTGVSGAGISLTETDEDLPVGSAVVAKDFGYIDESDVVLLFANKESAEVLLGTLQDVVKSFDAVEVSVNDDEANV